jgi:hypothetical protein
MRKEIQRVYLCDLDSKEFYEKYVKTRTPIIINFNNNNHNTNNSTTTTSTTTTTTTTSTITTNNNRYKYNKYNDMSSSSKKLSSIFNKWSDLDYLKKMAGNCTVQVETRNIPNQNSSSYHDQLAENDNESLYCFGSDRKRKHVLFKHYLDNVKTGDSSLYLSTQYNDSQNNTTINKDSLPHILLKETIQQPLSHPNLMKQIPLRPSIMGNLIPQQLNLWLGAADPSSAEGVSSGLHHDFADNLYCLIEGRKTFTLFPPDAAEVP